MSAHLLIVRRLLSVLAIAGLLVPSFVHAATLLYVVNSSNDNVRVINLEDDSVVANIGVDFSPTYIAQNGTGAFVVNNSGGSVTVIDLTNNQIETEFQVGSTPYGIAFSGTGIYVVNGGDETLSVIDRTNYEEERTVAVGSIPRHVATSGTGIYVVNNGPDTVSVIDMTDYQLVTNISVGNNPLHITINGTGAYVTNAGSNNVSVIDIRTNLVVKAISAGSIPFGVAVDTSGTGGFIGNSNGDSVTVFDRTDNLPITTLAVSDGARYITVSGTGAYVAIGGSNTVAVIDTQNLEVEREISGFSSPFASIVSSDTSTRAPVLTAPTTGASTEVCDDLTITYTLPETPTSGTVQLQFYNTSTHTSVYATLNNSTGATFALDLEDFSASANVASTTGGNSIGAGSYVLYLSYQDQFGNTAADDSANLTVTACTTSSSSSSASSSVTTPLPGGGSRPITLEYKLQVSQQRFGSSNSSSSFSRQPLTVGGTRYDDVWTDTWFATFVRKIIELKIFEGYKTIDGTPLNKFGAEDPITLGQLAKVGTILWEKKDIEPKPTGDEWFKPYIAKTQHYQLSVFTGTPNALTHATRAQVVQTVIEALAFPLKTGASPFSDVSLDHPNAQAIITASMLGFIKGDDGTNNFRPNELINRAEVAKILSLALGNVGINYIDDMRSAKATSSASSTSSISQSSTPSSAPSHSSKDIRYAETAILNVRADARINSTLLWTARQGQEFEVLRIVGDWAHVRVSDGNEGYVWAAYLTK